MLERADEIRTPKEVQAVLSLVPIHSPQDDALRLRLDPERCSRLRELTLRWEGIVEEHDEGSRATLAVLLGSIGCSEDASIISTWIDREAERAEAEAQETGRPRLTIWSGWYASALASLETESARKLLRERVADPRYFADASQALVRLAVGRQDSFSFRLPSGRYREIARAQERGDQRDTDRELSDLIAGQLMKHLRERHDVSRPYPVDIAEAALALAQLGDARLLEILPELARLRVGNWNLLAIVEAALLRGVRIPYEVIENLIEIMPAQSYDQRDFVPIIGMGCAGLYSDPTRAAAVLRGLIPRIRAHEGMETLISALGWCTHRAAHDLLLDLAQLLNRHGWLAHELIPALANHPTPLSLDTVLRAGKLADVDGSLISAAIAQMCSAKPDVWEAVRESVTSTRDAREREILAQTLLCLGSVEAFVAACDLLDDAATNPIPFYLERLWESAFLEQRADPTVNAYSVHPRSCNLVRSRLFWMWQNDERRKVSARQVLLGIEKMRLDYGRPKDEPRHPVEEAIGAVEFP